MREPRPDWSSLGVNFKILDEHPHLFFYSSPPPPPGNAPFLSHYNAYQGRQIGRCSVLMARYMKVVRFCAKVEFKRVRVWNSEWSTPVQNCVKHPLPPPHVSDKLSTVPSLERGYSESSESSE